MSKLEEIRAILQGIDKDEIESDDGWWQTSTGAEFGTSVLARIERLLEAPEPPSASPGMAEVIAAHTGQSVDISLDGQFTFRCYGCGKSTTLSVGRSSASVHAAHVAKELAKAGYGLVPK